MGPESPQQNTTDNDTLVQTQQTQESELMFEHMAQSFEHIKPAITEAGLRDRCDGDPALEKLLEQFMDYANRYAEDVWSMHQFIEAGTFDTPEGAAEFAEMDDNRTRLHTALVDSIRILARNLVKAGYTNEWAADLMSGNELERAACGKFALLLVYSRWIDKTNG